MVTPIPLEVFYSTSLDIDHPDTNVIDNDETTFWTTTGLYPQEIALKFIKPAQITRITTVTGKVKSFDVYAATNKELTEWAKIDSTNLPANPIKQPETHQLNYQRTAYGIKIVITKGWDQFSALYMVRAEGPIVQEEEEQPK